jgi:hypothetical protein
MTYFDFRRVRFRANQLIPHQEPCSRIGLAGTTFMCIEPASMHFGLTKPNSRHRLTMINIQIYSGHKIESLSETRWTLEVNFATRVCSAGLMPVYLRVMIMTNFG